MKWGDEGIFIQWEDSQEDLYAKLVGELKIVIDGRASAPTLKVVRLSPKLLPGEMQLMDKLVEGINKAVYKKGIAVRLENSDAV